MCIDGVAATPICSAAAGSNNPTGLIFFPITLPGVTDSTLTSQVHVWVVQLSVALVVKVAALTVLRMKAEPRRLGMLRGNASWGLVAASVVLLATSQLGLAAAKVRAVLSRPCCCT